MTSSKPRSGFMQQILRLARDDRGVSAIAIALLAGSLIGVVGLGVEAGMWFTDARALQTQADAAAIAGAYQAVASAPLATVQSVGSTEAQNNGFSPGGSNAIAINEITYASTPAVQAVLTTPKTPTFLTVFSTGNVNVQATAVATYGLLGNACVLALDTSGQGISLTGSPSVNAKTCVLASNSTTSQSIYTNDNGDSINARGLYSAGGVSLHSSSNLVTWNSSGTQTVDVPPLVNQQPLTDPFSTEPAPAPTGSCDSSTNTPSSPGYYCDMGGYSGHNSSWTLNPGTYYVASGGSFTVDNTTLTGSGVTIVLMGSASASFKNSTITLTAPLLPATPTTPFVRPYPGILLYQDPSATAGSTALSFPGGNSSPVTLNGAVYAPNGVVTMQGTPATSGNLSNCLIVVAYQVSFNGNSTMNDSGCSGAFGGTYSLDQVKQVAIAE